MKCHKTSLEKREDKGVSLQNKITVKFVYNFIYLYALVFLGWLKYTMTVRMLKWIMMALFSCWQTIVLSGLNISTVNGMFIFSCRKRHVPYEIKVFLYYLFV